MQQLERAELPVEVRALDAERLGGVGDAAVVLRDNGGDVLALETLPRLAKRRAKHRVQPIGRVERDVLEKRPERNRGLRRHLHEALEKVLHLAHVPVPRQGRKHRLGGHVHRLLLDGERLARPRHKVLRQRGNVLAPLPKRRDLDLELREAAVKIRPHAPFIDKRLKPGLDNRHRAAQRAAARRHSIAS